MLHVCLEDYRCADLIYQLFVSACHLFQSGIYHSLKCHLRCETFIDPLKRHVRIFLFKPVNKRFNVFHRFGFLAGCLCGITNHYLIYPLFTYVINQKIKQLVSRNCCEAVCNYLQWVTDSNAALLSSVVD